MSERLSFIDWMKAIGMALIVWGHTGSDSIIRPTEPFNPKQLGVAFFVFVLGFSLARESRPRIQVLFNRLFPIYLVGLSIALMLSAIDWFRVGDLRESNYLPLALGINVLFNFFPANPTTWFIGTYTHLLIIWAVLARFRFNRIAITIVLGIEIFARLLLMKFAGSYIAYMLSTNWMTVFVLGLFFGQRASLTSQPKLLNLGALGALLLLMILWSMSAKQLVISQDFPFNIITLPTETVSLLATSAAISSLYLSITLLLYRATLGLPRIRFIEFLARNTLFVFIVHMPLIYAIAPVYYPLVPSKLLRIPINLTLFFILPAAFSECLFRLIDLKHLRDSTYEHLRNWFRSGSSPGLQHDQS